MVILIVSDTESSGGAAMSTINLALAFTRQGHKVCRLVATPDGRTSKFWTTISFWPRANRTDRIKSRLRKKLPSALKSYLAERRFRKIVSQVKPDVINFHNILWAGSEGMTIDLYRIAARQCITLVTMHDLWNTRGYPYDYHHVKDTRIIPKDFEGPIENEHAIKLRELVFGQQNLYFISPSRWLADRFRSQFPEHSSRVTIIPYGIDTSIYKPVDKVAARDILEIPKDRTVLLASAASLSYINKGFGILLQVLRERSTMDLCLVLMGDDTEIIPGSFPDDLLVKSFGFVNDKVTKNLIYNAADFLAFPSIADNLPNSIMECISAGTPVAGFDTCGIPDLVIPGKSGWLASKVDIESYKAVIEKAIEDCKTERNLRESCRAFAVENFKLEDQAIKYNEFIVNHRA